MLLCLENQASCAAVWGGPVTTSLHRPKHGLATEQPLRLPGISGGEGGWRGEERSGTFASLWCHPGHLPSPLHAQWGLKNANEWQT